MAATKWPEKSDDQRQEALMEAIAKAQADGWDLQKTEPFRAELSTLDGRTVLSLEVDRLGAVSEHRRALSPEPTAAVPTAAVVGDRSSAGWRSWVRGISGLGLVLALVVMMFSTASSISDATVAKASAIQIIQLYTEPIFYSLCLIGVSIGLYIFSRAGE